MEYIVLDLEWNQPVSKNSYPYLNIGDKMSSEIIQMGAYKLTENLEIAGSFCTYIKPKYYKKLNSTVKRITKINKEMVLGGKSFEEAIKLFRAWCGDDFCIFTWGSDDVSVMQQNLRFYEVDGSFIHKWYDLQRIFAKTFLGESTQKSLQAALEFFGIAEKADKQLHDALDDAYYTSKILMRHDIGACLKMYTPTSDFAKMCDELDDTKYGAFFTKRKAMLNKDVSQVLCPECGEVMEKYDSWLSVNGKYVCLASCDEHGEYVSRIKINKHLDGKFYVNKVTKKSSAKTRANVLEKYEKAKEKSKYKKSRVKT